MDTPNFLLDRLQQRLHDRAQTDALRSLQPPSKLVDLSSNDYLSFARSSSLSDRVAAGANVEPVRKNGSTGSRLLTGNPDIALQLEAKLAEFHQAEAALVFSSGYTANLGLLSAIVQRNDNVFYDARIHASVRDGLRLTHGKSHVFRHSDLDDLAKKVARNIGPGWVVVEGLYSMDGDLAPLAEIAAFCSNKGLGLLVDEAHSSGIYGPLGRGWAAESGIADQTFARIHTFGKAMGIHGAVIVGSQTLIDSLVNFSRPFIYTTGIPVDHWRLIEAAHEELLVADQIRERLHQLVRYFCRHAAELGLPFTGHRSPIQCLVVPGNSKVRALAKHLQDLGLDVRAILHPTVAKGEERIRVCLHAHNNEQEIDRLLSGCVGFLENA